VNPQRSLLPLVLILALGLGGCGWFDRGSHPRMIGSAAPDFTVTDSDHTVSLHDYRGKIVVLNFWSAHCAPCIAEMPSLVQLQKRMGDKIAVVGVAVDTKDDEYHAFLRKHGIDFVTVLDSAKNSYNLYGATGYPETTIIDRNGMARRKFVMAVDWSTPEIVEYLNKL
jgi:peroxiredoxin